MSGPPVIRELSRVLTGEVLLPTLTRYNRLESRPRTENFTRALRAEVRDALWMLCKQWQMGEFLGDDAGSPVSAKLHVAGERLVKYEPLGGVSRELDASTPLEATVERRPVRLASGARPLSLDLRLQLGRRWLQMIPASAAAKFKAQCAVASPDPAAKDDAVICAHAEVHQQFSAVAGRAMDGGKLYLHLTESDANRASDLVSGLDPGEQTAVDAAGPELVSWFNRMYSVLAREERGAFQPERLEYAFACSTPDGSGGEQVLRAEEYAQGRLDWYSFDWDRSTTFLGDAPAPAGTPFDRQFTTRSFIPASLRFNGMPDTRWWSFEDGKTNFGDIKPGKTELAKLLLIEFGLVYANDWFIVPYTVPAGSVLRIQGLSVTNTFGERFWIEAAGSGPDSAWQRWAMYGLSTRGQGDERADQALLVLPTVPKVQEGSPREVVVLTRDEMANMVWGIETVVPVPDGRTRRGNVAASEYLGYLQALHDGAAPPSPPPFVWKADVRFDLMTTVPEHWIPCVPEHVPGDNRSIQLRRAALPRTLANDPAPTFERVRPRTTLLREGLDDRTPYRIHEEEVSRAGTWVQEAFQRTRYTGGRVVTWLGVQKRTGRGEGHSGLAFDRVVPTGK